MDRTPLVLAGSGEVVVQVALSPKRIKSPTSESEQSAFALLTLRSFYVLFTTGAGRSQKGYGYPRQARPKGIKRQAKCEGFLLRRNTYQRRRSYPARTNEKEDVLMTPSDLNQLLQLTYEYEALVKYIQLAFFLVSQQEYLPGFVCGNSLELPYVNIERASVYAPLLLLIYITLHLIPSFRVSFVYSKLRASSTDQSDFELALARILSLAAEPS